MPNEVLEMMAIFDFEVQKDSDNANSKDNKQSKPPSQSKNSKKRKVYELPGLDSVIRPSMDRGLREIAVTDIFHKAYSNPLYPASQPPMMRTVAANRVVDLHDSAVVNIEQDDPDRIRGGGDNETANANLSEDLSERTTLASNVMTEAPGAATQTQAQSSGETAGPTVVNFAAPSQVASAATRTIADISSAVPAAPKHWAAVAAATSSTTKETSAPPSATNSSAPCGAPALAPMLDTAPAASTSSAPVPSRALDPLAPAEDKVIQLDKKPVSHWQHQIPSANDENLTDPKARTKKPAWFHPTWASSLERTLLPEWFDRSASHRTEESYLKARSTMIHISNKLENRFVTSTLARRSLPGDVGSLHRLHSFLTSYLWINEDGKNDSTPTPPSLQQLPQLTQKVWTEMRREDLIRAVAEVSQKHSNYKQKVDVGVDPMEVASGAGNGAKNINAGNSFVSIDWIVIAQKVGASPGDCEREFLAMPLDHSAVVGTNGATERPLTPDTKAGESPRSRARSKTPKDELAQEALLRSLVEETSPEVRKSVAEAALKATGRDLPAAQCAARLGLVASQTAKTAQAHAETVSRLGSQVLDQRMQKLECRMALMDDLEGMLEAERVALELERRDLYTTRCRDWFGF